MGDTVQDRRPEHVVLHFLPVEALRKAQALAQRLQQEEALRSYVVRRLWWVIPAVLLLGALLASIIVDGAGRLVRALPHSVEQALMHGAVIFVLVAWFAATMLVTYLLLAWLERRARQMVARGMSRKSDAAGSAGPLWKRPIGRPLLLALALVLLAGFAYKMHDYATAERRMRTTCAAISPGMSFAELKDFAARNRLLSPAQSAEIAYLADRRTFGRHACKVTLQRGAVVRSEYNYAD